MWHNNSRRITYYIVAEYQKLSSPCLMRPPKGPAWTKPWRTMHAIVQLIDAGRDRGPSGFLRCWTSCTLDVICSHSQNVYKPGLVRFLGYNTDEGSKINSTCNIICRSHFTDRLVAPFDSCWLYQSWAIIWQTHIHCLFSRQEK